MVKTEAHDESLFKEADLAFDVLFSVFPKLTRRERYGLLRNFLLQLSACNPPLPDERTFRRMYEVLLAFNPDRRVIHSSELVRRVGALAREGMDMDTVLGLVRAEFGPDTLVING